jgi:hypothetical protein
MNAPFFSGLIAVAIGGVVTAHEISAQTLADVTPPEMCVPCVTAVCVADDAPPSWIFRRSTYSHDPMTGARVAQYMRTPPVEPLDDERNVTSRYRRSRTNLRGADGSIDSYYEVQAWGNGRGGLDAEWERFHDAWKESYLQGGWYNQGPGFNHGRRGPWRWDNNFNGWHGTGFPGWGHPGSGWNGGWGGGGNWGPPGPWPHSGGPQGGGPHSGGP